MHCKMGGKTVISMQPKIRAQNSQHVLLRMQIEKAERMKLCFSIWHLVKQMSTSLALWVTFSFIWSLDHLLLKRNLVHLVKLDFLFFITYTRIADQFIYDKKIFKR